MYPLNVSILKFAQKSLILKKYNDNITEMGKFSGAS